MCRKSFKKVDHIDCTNTMFQVKKRAFFTPFKPRWANIESSWLKTFALHKVEAFGIALGNWAENP
jgi:hypothetical protein